MSPSDANLKDIRARLGELVTGRKIVLIGVGNELRGDDAFGVWLGERIEHRIPQRVFVTHDLPEDYAVKAADLRPDIVIVLDATNFGGEPGELHLVAARDVPPTPGVTHRPSLEMMARFIELDAGAETWVLGVQPQMDSVGVGSEMSAPVAAALDALEAMLLEMLLAAEA